jgi:transglutaminase-like putative cysteine protease
VRYRIHHVTHYEYSEPVSGSQHDLHLLPRDTERQRCLSAALEIAPAPGVCRERRDYFGNRATHVALAAVHDEFQVVARSEVECTPSPPRNLDEDSPWQEAAAEIAGARVDLHVQEMALASPFIAASRILVGYARDSFPAGRSVLRGSVELMARIHRDFVYDAGATTIATPLEEVFAKRRGVCQDFSHLMIACLRGLGLAARYVSGYLATTPPPGQPRLQGADASHAWLSVYSPRFGFVDLDPTNNVVVGEQHVTLAFGRDFGDVTPLRGVIQGGGRHELQVGVDMLPVG